MTGLRRAILTLAIAAAVVVVLALLIASWHPVQHWVAIHTGTENAGPDKFYNWWSGFGSDLGEATLIAAILGPIYVAARHHNCATRGCWRLTTHTIEDPDTHVKHNQCVKCHPGIPSEHSHHGIFRNHFTDEHLDDVRARVLAEQETA